MSEELLNDPSLEAASQAFSEWKKDSDGLTLVRNAYVDMAGDLTAGVMLSRLVYWHSLSKEGKRRLKVQKNGKYWIVKGYSDWHEECRISKDQAKRAVKKLLSRGLIETQVKLFYGAPTLHIRILPNGFLKAWTMAVAAGTEMEKRETHLSSPDKIEQPLEKRESLLSETGETHLSESEESRPSEKRESRSTVTETLDIDDLSKNTSEGTCAVTLTDNDLSAVSGKEEAQADQLPAPQARYEGNPRQFLSPAFQKLAEEEKRKRKSKEEADQQRRNTVHK